ncbi:MAG: citryl-CoA lyase [Candidatus Woesearchaeota archaeon]|nr:citryl-CoA lyase [Candidatus Woesearchaeota archaeon]
MEFKTAISKMTETDHIIRGEKLSQLVTEGSFTDAVFLLLNKRKPTAIESKLFSAMLTSIIDHGMGVTSSMATRFVMSGGNTLNTAVGAGILALGDYHGGAIEKAMEFYHQIIHSRMPPDVLANYIGKLLDEKKTIFGYGHAVYNESDPRTKQLIALCESLSYYSPYITLAIAIEKIIETKKGKKLCLNVDGVIAAILLEMGFHPSVGKGIFIIGRTPGLVAQAMEEQEREKPVRRVEEKDIQYDGLL